MNRVVIYLFCSLFSLALYGQESLIKGELSSDGKALEGVSIALLNTPYGAVTGEQGQYEIKGVPAGEYTLKASYIGYRASTVAVQLKAGEAKTVDLTLEPDILRLEDVVVSATRNAVPAHRAPIMVNRIDERVFNQTQSLSLSEGLSFSPGLRLENNCQNCGFTQLRMNGLAGPYTQVLINSRPVFSALAGVYGLEMIPSNMVERVEVVRGGGSALYGGNAIAGTVNILTKDPLSNTFEIGSNLAYIDGNTPDRTLTVNGSIVDDNLQKGLSFYAFNRSRNHWDANADGFSEITQLENTTFGLDAFFNPDNQSKIKLNLFGIDEFRRGGNRFDLAPHQTDITEQLDHRILGGNLSYERFSKDQKRKLSAYLSATRVERESYYGGGSRVLQPGDSLTEADLLAINAYGQSQDLSLVGGLQYAHELSEDWMLTVGSEYQYNDVLDEMPGYDRQIDQRVGTLGSYAQLEWKPANKWSFLLGGRYDYLNIDGLYELGQETFENERSFGVFVPRASAMYFFTPDLKLRMSYAQGYRAPQAFDEDLHIETVGGAALFTRLDPALETERSNSYSASLDYTYRQPGFESNFVIDGFYTQLNNPFITANQVELPSGVAVITKRNGSGATVAGANFEANLAFSSRWMLQLGGTLQTTSYDEAEEIWSPEAVNDANQDSVITAASLLRTPDHYGYFTALWTPDSPFSLSVSGIFTGSMLVPHVIDPQTEYTILERTPSFFELNTKATYELDLGKSTHIELFAGVQNLINSFQSDFDIGADRDAGYVYGPVRPRTVFFGVKFGME
jgi:outer membrane receptor for ferrienterochelin and colicins